MDLVDYADKQNDVIRKLIWTQLTLRDQGFFLDPKSAISVLPDSGKTSNWLKLFRKIRMYLKLIFFLFKIRTIQIIFENYSQNRFRISNRILKP